jgi:hypothetical protein
VTSSERHVGQKINILYLCAAPAGTRELAFTTEALAIQAAISGCPELDLQAFFHVQPDQIQGLLRTYRPVIVHFAGHGGAVDPAQVAGGVEPFDEDEVALLLQGRGGATAPVSGQLLRDILRYNLGSIRCVVLNACHSEAIAAEIVKSVDCAVGTAGAILDLAAVAFARAFYRAIAAGDHLANAIGAGSTQIPAEQLGAGAIVRQRHREGMELDQIRIVTAAPRASSASLPIDGVLQQILLAIQPEHRWVLEAFSRCRTPGNANPPPPLLKSYALTLAMELAELPLPKEVSSPGDGGVPPLLRFLRLLATAQGHRAPPIPEALRVQIEDWLSARGIPELVAGGVPEPTVRRKLGSVTWEAPDVHLHIGIRRKGEATFTLEAYRAGKQQTDTGAPALELAALKERVGNLVAAAATDPMRLCVEVFVDRRLLGRDGEFDLDQWTYEDPVSEEIQPLGRAGRLVVRDVKRADFRARFEEFWQIAWDRFCVASRLAQFTVFDYADGRSPDGDVACFSAAPGNPQALAEILKGATAACALLDGPDPGRGALGAVLDGCLPVALWARASCPAPLRPRVRAFLAERPLGELPERVRQARLHSDEDELGNHLTLLWDDPTDALGGGPFTGPGG